VNSGRYHGGDRLSDHPVQAFVCFLFVLGLMVSGVSWAGHKVGLWRPPPRAPQVDKSTGKEIRYPGSIRHHVTDSPLPLHFSDVWCRWSGNHVEMHMTIALAGTTPYQVEIYPHYVINGRDHGEAIGESEKYETLHRGRNDLLIDAGNPEGVGNDQPPVASCSPEVADGWPKTW